MRAPGYVVKTAALGILLTCVTSLPAQDDVAGAANTGKDDNPFTAVLRTAPYEFVVTQQELPRGTNPRKGDNPFTAVLQPGPYEYYQIQQELPRGTNPKKGDSPFTAVLQSGVTTRVLKQHELPADTGHRLSQNLIDRLAERAQSKTAGSSTEATQGSVLFQLPLRAGIANPSPGYYAISNYVDQDEMAPDSLLDYACGMRTYDLDNGYDHNGVDYFNYPLGWLTMDQDGVAVIAAADGIIIEKNDGEPDMNCSFSDDAVSNTIVLEHADGTITIYAHMKRNTVTSMAVGDTVEKGDYLGIIGSSGFSTGPHLHFGVVDSAGNLIEPHSGACNSLNADSQWDDQEDYYETGISLIATHSAIPEFPDCPGIEQPFFQDQFAADDSVFFSIFLRDALMGEVGTIEVLDPNGISLVTFPPLEYTDSDHAAAFLIAYGLDFNGSAISGAYTYRVTYAGQVMEHTFYINSGPDAPPPVVEANNNQNGLYFDPGKDGEGYNFVTTPAGTIIYFYGSDQFGNRLWLISDLIPGEFGPGSIVEVTMFESTGGTFDSPVPSVRGLSVWGTLIVDFTACDSAEATLDGVDGVKVSQLIKLAGSAGTGCGSGGSTSDSPWSGLWFAVVDDGEGYNLIVAGNGSVLYYYGFNSDGRRLWLISDLIVDELQVGVDVEAVMFESTQGDFDNPVPSAQSLVEWGTATITLVDCSHITIVMTGADGSKTSVTVRLAGVIGVECSD